MKEQLRYLWSYSIRGVYLRRNKVRLTRLCRSIQLRKLKNHETCIRAKIQKVFMNIGVNFIWINGIESKFLEGPISMHEKDFSHLEIDVAVSIFLLSMLTSTDRMKGYRNFFHWELIQLLLSQLSFSTLGSRKLSKLSNSPLEPLKSKAPAVTIHE